MLRLLLDLLTNENGKVRSSDPILDVLSVDPGSILGRKYAGYCLFLFGAADEELATWFSRNLVALDSLTGSDVACVVVAARVKVRVDKESLRERDDYLIKHDKPRSSIVEVGDIKRGYPKVEPMVSNGFSRWSGTTKEITALTYGTDVLARRLGVIGSLPCVLVIDAFPSDSYEILRLDEHATSSLIPLLREVMHRFDGEKNHFFFNRLSSAEDLQRRLEQMDEQIRSGEARLAAMKEKEPTAGPGHHRTSLKTALVEGNTPAFERALESSYVAADERAAATETVRSLWPELRQISKTLNNLNYFLAHDIWPLKQEWLRRITLIYDRHARTYAAEILGDIERESREYCIEMKVAIVRRQGFLVEEVMKGWRDVATICLELSERHERECDAAAEAIHQLRQDRAHASRVLDESLGEIVASKYPSLKDTFRDVARVKKIRTARNTVGDALVKMSASLLKPETLLKIVESLK